MMFVFDPKDISPLIEAARTAVRITLSGGSTDQRLFLEEMLGECAGTGEEELVIELGPECDTEVPEPSPLGHEPLRASNFAVRIAGVDTGFQGLSRLQLAQDRPRTVVLQRAIGQGRELFAWRQAIENWQADLRNVEIIHLTQAGGQAASRWILTGCWPVRWSGPEFHAMHPGLAMEEIELRYARVFWI